MTCLDYRRWLVAEGRESDEMKLHRLQCAACAQSFAEHESFDNELRRGLEIPVPHGLEERLASGHAARRRRFLAAAGVAGVAVGVGTYSWFNRDDPLALACIQFVMKDEAKSIMMGAMPRAEAERVLAGMLPLARLEQIGQVRHIGPCPFNGGTAYHAVLAVPQGKVTLLIMPDTTLHVGRRAVHEGLYADVIALKKGSVGIVGTDADVVASVSGALRA